MTPDTDPTPSEIFSQDATKRAALLALLTNPVMVEAMDIVENLMRPQTGGTTDTNQALAIAKFHQAAGADEFQKKLKKLTKAPVERVIPKIPQLAKTVEDLPK